MYTSPSQPGIRSLSNCPHPLGGQPTAAALVRLRCRKALQVAVPTVHWRDEHVFIIHVCPRAASFHTEMRSAWVGSRAVNGASDPIGGN